MSYNWISTSITLIILLHRLWLISEKQQSIKQSTATKDELFTDGNKFRGHCNDVTEILETQWIKPVHPGFTASRQRIRAKLSILSNHFSFTVDLPFRIYPERLNNSVSLFQSSSLVFFRFHILITTINSKGTELIWNWNLNSRSFSAWKRIL